MRSAEVAGVFGACFGRPDGFGSSDFAQIVDLFMLYRFIWASGADVIKIMDLLTEEASKSNDFSSENLRLAIVMASVQTRHLDDSRKQSFDFVSNQ